MNLESLYREEWRRVLATTVRLTGDFDLSEEAVQDAFVAALEQWPRDGTPANPYAWLVSDGAQPRGGSASAACPLRGTARPRSSSSPR